jgi:hypothetical protein
MTTNIPFPELSHHPLNTAVPRNGETEPGHSKNYENEPVRKGNTDKPHEQHTRVTTYV